MPRFYLTDTLTDYSDYSLPENIVRHVHVLRLNAGDALTLFNGDGNEYHAELTEVGKRQATCRITEIAAANHESKLNITLVQAISSGDRMDFTLQKSVELGVASIQPILSERCVVRLSGERADKRVQRWQEIVISACEQSGRNIVPVVQPIISLRDYLRQVSPDELHLLMSLNRATTLSNIAPAPEKVHLMIGPEGGWTVAEEQAAFDVGFQAVTLGKRVLRTETASLAAIAAMQTLWGDFI
ncbi:16S rRNA (uracil(1498)-N(3))-methyltransferase [Kingella negevensis]|uniref:16S rRNA (uracil(1498)-N(3))-methyltransferase n=1 Tax=Kingella negevensis TaxID=1522312 RepID=UPI00050A1271|nr:16S rRNA (uracil(1498)-N(3))-methyltransferase [Kingella negevensis]MDK4687930.1 16S rRNA (uracil(1498)-N(3))-methyltransferase [Kingella negevensis]WII91081.1 16S rRNA (uracil(1498)-N(3))-methyltransferase [Kingella negevensis]